MEYLFYHSAELYHHGVKGMKWGVRKKSRPASIQYNYKAPDQIRRPRLSKQEYAHVLSEVATYMTEEQRNLHVFTRNIGKNVYTILNNFDNTYDILSKKAIRKDYSNLYKGSK